VLHNIPKSNDNLIKNNWHLAIFNSRMELMNLFNLEEIFSFDTLSDEDMLYTDLRVEKGNLTAVITYTFTGSGGFPEQGARFQFSRIDNGFYLRKFWHVKYTKNKKME